MKAHSLNLQTKGQASSSRIIVGSELLASAGELILRATGKTARRAIIVSNQRVFHLYGEQVSRSLAIAGLKVSIFLMPDGERYKTLRTAEKLLATMSKQGIARTDVVVGLGGGVAGDLSGFAASVHLRGVPFFLIPTTLLAMVDASVGGKTGVNTSYGKNLVGAFHHPTGVLVDTATLQSLDRRDVSAGLCEMVKHGLLAADKLWAQTQKLLETPLDREHPNRANVIAENIRFKAVIVAGDEQESVERSDPRSRKILNLGHTFAHALEKVTNYRQLRHGEAVGHGLKFAAHLSNSLDLLDKESVKLINDVVHRTGLTPVPTNVGAAEVLEAFGHDKKVIGGSLQMVLLKGIGRPIIHTFDRIPREKFKRAFAAVLQ